MRRWPPPAMTEELCEFLRLRHAGIAQFARRSTLTATAARCTLSGRRCAVTSTSSRRGGACDQAGPATARTTATDNARSWTFLAPQWAAPVAHHRRGPARRWPRPSRSGRLPHSWHYFSLARPPFDRSPIRTSQGLLVGLAKSRGKSGHENSGVPAVTVSPPLVTGLLQQVA